MLHVSVTGSEEVARLFEGAYSQVRSQVLLVIAEQANALKEYVQAAELSGQMLKVRTGKRRTEMAWSLKESEKAITAIVHPKPGSALWMLGSGMAPRKISVRRTSSAVERRAARANGRRGWKRRLRRMVGTYSRTHHLHKVPFMKVALFGHRAQIRGAIETAVWDGVRDLKANLKGG